MKATHTNYLHPRHLRVEQGGVVLCMAPSCSDYARLSGKSLSDYRELTSDQREALA